MKCKELLYIWIAIFDQGIVLELQAPAYTTATATPDPGLVYELYHSSRQHARILNLLSEATRIEPASSWILVGFISTEPQQEFLFCLFCPSYKWNNTVWMLSFPHSLLIIKSRRFINVVACVCCFFIALYDLIMWHYNLFCFQYFIL